MYVGALGAEQVGERIVVNGKEGILVVLNFNADRPTIRIVVAFPRDGLRHAKLHFDLDPREVVWAT